MSGHSYHDNQKPMPGQASLAAPEVHVSEDEPAEGYVGLHAPRHLQRRDPQLSDVIDILRSKSDLGAAQIKEAQSYRVLFQRRDLDGNAGGHAFMNLVALNRSNSLAQDVSILPHELMHMRQFYSGYGPFPHWSIKSRFQQFLHMEAGAETCAVKVAYEARQNGYADAFNERVQSVQFGAYQGFYKGFETAYEDARLQGIEDPALEASDSVYQAYLASGRLKLTYGAIELSEYMHGLSFTRGATLPRDVFDPSRARAYSVSASGKSLIRESTSLHLEDQALFHNTGHLRHAFEYADLMHTAMYYRMDKQAPVFQEKLGRAIGGDNPFLRLEFNRVMQGYNDFMKEAAEAKLSASKRYKAMLTTMIQLAGVEEIEPR